MNFPLLEALHSQHGLPLMSAEDIATLQDPGQVWILLLSEDPQRYPEALDLAVILPELLRAFPQLKAGVIRRGEEATLRDLYHIQAWPCFLFLRGKDYLGQICKVQDWAVYLQCIEDLLDTTAPTDPLIPAISQDGDTSNV